jgi:uncharacterized surface protein with fasciclin (FAS1) repeats
MKKIISAILSASLFCLVFTGLNLTELPEAKEAGQPETSVYELISMTDQLSIFHELVESAGMSDILHEESPITVFLPVNDAFNTLPDGVLESYREDEEALQELLNHHIVAAEVASRDLEDGEELEMKSGSTALVSITDMGLELDDANVIQVDVDASNGLIHVVNEVILPEE